MSTKLGLPRYAAACGLGLAILLTGWTHAVAAQEGELKPLERLNSATAGTARWRALRELLAERKSTIAFLRTIVKEPVARGERWAYHSTRRNLAITLLGELRAGEAAGEIAEWLICHPGQQRLRTILRSERKGEYASVAMVALVKIGKPANEVLLNKLKRVDDQTVKEQLARMDEDMRTACCRTLAKIEGREIAQLLLAKRIAAAKDDRLRANLEAALKYLETVENYVIAPLRSTRRETITPAELARIRALVKNTRSTQPPPESSPTLSGLPQWVPVASGLAGLLLGFAAAALLFRRRSTGSRP